MNSTDLDPRLWDKSQKVAMALAAAIGAALLVIWHPPGILNAYRCMHYSVAGWCSEMWRVDIGPTLGWIVLGALIGKVDLLYPAIPRRERSRHGGATYRTLAASPRAS
jgi:hypothetical protein